MYHLGELVTEGRQEPALFMRKANAVFLAEKRATKDNGDGLFSLAVAAQPSDLPDDLKFAPTRATFRIALAILEADGPLIGSTRAQRLPIADLGNGLVSVSFALLPRSLDDRILYAKRGTPVRMSVHPDPSDEIDASGYTPDQRRRTMQRIVLLCKEDAFRDWISQNHDPAGLIRKTAGLTDLAEHATAEAILRRIGAHSRAEILRNAIVCERAEVLIRMWREQRFDPLPIQFGTAA